MVYYKQAPNLKTNYNNMKTSILTDSNQEKPLITSKSDVCAIPGIADNKTVWFRAVPDKDLKTWIVGRTQFNSPQQAIAQDYRFSGKLSKSVLLGAISRARHHIDKNESNQAMHDLEILVEAAELSIEFSGFIESLRDL